jgi:hypothetical protein
MQLRLPLREGGFRLHATGVFPDSNAFEYQRSLPQHTASFLAAAARCHDALPKAHPSLSPISQLHFVPSGLYTAPSPSPCASLWRYLVHNHPPLQPVGLQVAMEDGCALPPDPSLIPVSADTVTQQVRLARPTILHALTQHSGAELFHACDSPLHRARLLSLRCWHAGTYLDTVAANPYLCLSDGDFINGCHFCLGAQPALIRMEPLLLAFVVVTSSAATSTTP